MCQKGLSSRFSNHLYDLQRFRCLDNAFAFVRRLPYHSCLSPFLRWPQEDSSVDMQQYKQPHGGQEASLEVLSVDGVLEKVLAYMSQRCLLRSCSRVCSRWHTAAVFVTVGKGVVSAAASDALLEWLRRHGTGLRSLTVRSGSLYRDSGYGSMSSLQQLSRLELRNMTERPTILGAVGNSLQNLVHLSLNSITFTHLHTPAVNSTLSVEVSKLLAGCSRLTHLQIKGCFITDFLAAIGRSLPQFKLLDLSDNHHRLDVSAALINSGGNVRLLQLQTLSVKGMKLTRPDVLSELTMLTSLSLADVSHSNLASLLAALSQLLQLRDLDMSNWQGRRFTVAALRDALMPLTQLTALRLSNTEYDDDPAALELQLSALLSPDQGRRPAVGGLFPGLYLPRLKVLDANKLYWTTKKTRAHRPLCGTGDFKDITAAIPAISCLRVKGSMAWTQGGKAYLDLEPLSAVAGSLTSLEMSAGQGLRDGHLQSLIQLPGLSSLVVTEVGSHITDHGILGLSSLSALSHLELTGVTSRGVSMELLPERGSQAASEFKLQSKMDMHGCLEATVAQQLVGLSLNSRQMQQQIMNKARQEARGEAEKAQDEVVELQGLLASLQERLKQSLVVQEPVAG